MYALPQRVTQEYGGGEEAGRAGKSHNLSGGFRQRRIK